MKTTFNVKSFTQSLILSARCVAKRSTLPILANARLVQTADRFEIVTTDLDNFLSVSMPNVGEVGETTVPACQLRDTVKLCKGEVEIETAAQKLAVRNGSNFSLDCLPVSEFPAMPDFNKPEKFTVKIADLRRALKLVSFAQSTEQSRYVLNGICFEIAKGNLRLVATDGKRCALNDILATMPEKMDDSFILPSGAVSLLESALPKPAKKELPGLGEISIEMTKNNVRFSFETLAGVIQLTSKKLEGNFPHYRQIIPGKGWQTVNFNRVEFLAALKTAEKFTDEKSNSVKLSFTNGQCVVSAKSEKFGGADKTLAMNWTGAAWSIAFNPRYMIECVETGDAEMVEMVFQKDDEVLSTDCKQFYLNPGPAQIVSESFLYVIMPMSLGKDWQDVPGAKDEDKPATIEQKPVVVNCAANNQPDHAGEQLRRYLAEMAKDIAAQGTGLTMAFYAVNMAESMAMSRNEIFGKLRSGGMAEHNIDYALRAYPTLGEIETPTPAKIVTPHVAPLAGCSPLGIKPAVVSAPVETVASVPTYGEIDILTVPVNKPLIARRNQAKRILAKLADKFDAIPLHKTYNRRLHRSLMTDRELSLLEDVLPKYIAQIEAQILESDKLCARQYVIESNRGEIAGIKPQPEPAKHLPFEVGNRKFSDLNEAEEFARAESAILRDSITVRRGIATLCQWTNGKKNWQNCETKTQFPVNPAAPSLPAGWASPLPGGNLRGITQTIASAKRAAKLASVKPLAGELPEPEKPFEIARAELENKFADGWQRSIAAGSVPAPVAVSPTPAQGEPEPVRVLVIRRDERGEVINGNFPFRESTGPVILPPIHRSARDIFERAGKQLAAMFAGDNCGGNGQPCPA